MIENNKTKHKNTEASQTEFVNGLWMNSLPGRRCSGEPRPDARSSQRYRQNNAPYMPHSERQRLIGWADPRPE